MIAGHVNQYPTVAMDTPKPNKQGSKSGSQIDVSKQVVTIIKVPNEAYHAACGSS